MRRRAGLREPRAAYAADALVALATDGRCKPVEVHLIANSAPVARGHTEPGERCEIKGIGPVPVTRLAELEGIEHFRVRPTEHGWAAMPEGMTEGVEFPGGTWRVVMVMPADLSITEAFFDPLVLLVALANGAAKVDDKLRELVAYCRSTGKSWTQIGQALGMTKQAAWERFSGEE